MNIIERNRPEAGNEIVNVAFESIPGSISRGFVKTPYCLVEVYAVYGEEPYGFVCCNYNRRYYQVNFNDHATHKALIARAHKMMRQIVASYKEDTY